MIPKTIHYCWFGRNPKPKLATKCIRSWKKHCPDYEIIEWNEDNFDISSAPLYVRQAYEAKKWAFVTDYVRLYAMVNYGGIYMDTDVEVIKPLDPFLHHRAFSGFEREIHIPTGIMACEKGFPLFQTFLDYYEDATFINHDGSLNLTTNVIVITEICTHKGFLPNGQYQIVDGFALYPKDFFCPTINPKGICEKTDNTITIHWFAGSWLEGEAKKQKQLMEECAKKSRQLELRHTIQTIPNRIVKGILGEQRYTALKKRIKRGSYHDS